MLVSALGGVRRVRGSAADELGDLGHERRVHPEHLVARGALAEEGGLQVVGEHEEAVPAAGREGGVRGVTTHA